MPFAATWMDQEIIIQRQVSYYITYMQNLKKKKNDTNELIYKTETDSQREQNLRLPEEKVVGRIGGLGLTSAYFYHFYI